MSVQGASNQPQSCSALQPHRTLGRALPGEARGAVPRLVGLGWFEVGCWIQVCCGRWPPGVVTGDSPAHYHLLLLQQEPSALLQGQDPRTHPKQVVLLPCGWVRPPPPPQPRLSPGARQGPASEPTGAQAVCTTPQYSGKSPRCQTPFVMC